MCVLQCTHTCHQSDTSRCAILWDSIVILRKQKQLFSSSVDDFVGLICTNPTIWSSKTSNTQTFEEWHLASILHQNLSQFRSQNFANKQSQMTKPTSRKSTGLGTKSVKTSLVTPPKKRLKIKRSDASSKLSDKQILITETIGMGDQIVLIAERTPSKLGGHMTPLSKESQKNEFTPFDDDHFNCHSNDYYFLRKSHEDNSRVPMGESWQEMAGCTIAQPSFVNPLLKCLTKMELAQLKWRKISEMHASLCWKKKAKQSTLEMSMLIGHPVTA